MPPPPPADATPPELTCNGSAENCTRRFDEVAIAATHNAYSYSEGGPVKYLFPNQDRPIPDQLAAGVRGFGIRPAPYFGDDPAEKDRVYTTHNVSLMGKLGQEPLVDVLRQIRAFLVARPREVISLFAESAVPAEQVAATFAEAGLLPYLYEHDAARGFPTLDGLAQQGKRVVVYYQGSGDPQAAWAAWMLPMWDFIVDTDYNITAKSQFKCDFYRGTPKSPIYFINQFIYKSYGTIMLPDKENSQIANEPGFIRTRVEDCEKQTGRRANVVYVDWFGQGDVVGAVNALNQRPRP